MTLDELAEAKSILQTMMTALGGTLVGASGTTAADLRYGISDLLQNADTLIRSASLGTPLLNVFELATTAGATISTLEKVRTALLAQSPTTYEGTLLQAMGIQMTLAQEVQVYTGFTFASRQDVDAAIDQLNAAFDQAMLNASETGDSTSYQALLQANAAIVNDLTTRQRPLPNMITYSVPRVMTSLALANYLYGDASRADELVAENAVADPHFCPMTGYALSN